MRSTRPRVAGPSGPSPSSSTSTSFTGATTSPPGRNRPCSAGAGWRAILVVRLLHEGSAAVRYVRRVGSSDCGLAVIRHDTQDRLQVIGRVGAELKSNADMPSRSGDDQHLEVAVPDDEVPQPAAVDVAAPGGEGEQGGVNQQLLVQIAVAAGRVLQIRPRSHL